MMIATFEYFTTPEMVFRDVMFLNRSISADSNVGQWTGNLRLMHNVMNSRDDRISVEIRN